MKSEPDEEIVKLRKGNVGIVNQLWDILTDPRGCEYELKLKVEYVAEVLECQERDMQDMNGIEKTAKALIREYERKHPTIQEV